MDPNVSLPQQAHEGHHSEIFDNQQIRLLDLCVLKENYFLTDTQSGIRRVLLSAIFPTLESLVEVGVSLVDSCCCSRIPKAIQIQQGLHMG